MHLSQLLIENNGSIEWLTAKFDLDDHGNAKPVILVGANGSGKTNLISIITDALFEAATVGFDNVLPSIGSKRSYFRTLGGRNVRSGASGSVALLQFIHDGMNITYVEKAGQVDAQGLRDRSPPDFQAQITWSDDKPLKKVGIAKDNAESIFQTGVYCYFPSDRSEVPYWQNPSNGLETRFSLDQTFTGYLTKPIYIDRAMSDFAQWLIGLLADSRTELLPPTPPDAQWRIASDANLALISSQGLTLCNKLLQIILDDSEVRFVWLGRASNQKIGISKSGILVLPDLGALSAGQSILLGLFGTLLRYSDISTPSPFLNPAITNGICLVDEIDSHVHLDLQYRAIPQLMRMFPKIQFICSTHSPMFVLGIEKEFGSLGAQILRMPDGAPVAAESFSEFLTALEIIKATHSFDQALLSEARAGLKPIVYLEGETDPAYCRAAASAIGRDDLLAQCEFEWIGAKDTSGKAFNTGKDALRHARNLFVANPGLARRKVILLGDNDTKFASEDHQLLFMRAAPTNDQNNVIKHGIENLLPQDVFTEDFFEVRTTDKGNGQTITLKTLKKTALCTQLCRSGTAQTFAKFADLFRVIDPILTPT